MKGQSNGDLKNKNLGWLGDLNPLPSNTQLQFRALLSCISMIAHFAPFGSQQGQHYGGPN